MDITLWFRLNEKGLFEFNHLEDGFSDTQQKPTVKHPNQESSWKKATWKKRKAKLENGVVIENDNQ